MHSFRLQRARKAVVGLAIVGLGLAPGLLGQPVDAAPGSIPIDESAPLVAAPTSISVPLSGSLGTGGEPSPLPPGSTFTGSFDAAGGPFRGDLAFPQVATPELQLKLSATAPLAGTLDPATNAVSATTTLALDVLALLGPDVGGELPVAPCRFAPIALELAGTFDPGTGTVTLHDDTVTIPPAAVDPTSCAGLAPDLNPAIAGAGNAAVLTFSIVPGTAPPAPSAGPQRATPTFTG